MERRSLQTESSIIRCHLVNIEARIAKRCLMKTWTIISAWLPWVFYLCLALASCACVNFSTVLIALVGGLFSHLAMTVMLTRMYSDFEGERPGFTRSLFFIIKSLKTSSDPWNLKTGDTSIDQSLEGLMPISHNSSLRDVRYCRNILRHWISANPVDDRTYDYFSYVSWPKPEHPDHMVLPDPSELLSAGLDVRPGLRIECGSYDGNCTGLGKRVELLTSRIGIDRFSWCYATSSGKIPESPFMIHFRSRSGPRGGIMHPDEMVSVKSGGLDLAKWSGTVWDGFRGSWQYKSVLENDLNVGCTQTWPMVMQIPSTLVEGHRGSCQDLLRKGRVRSWINSHGRLGANCEMRLEDDGRETGSEEIVEQAPFPLLEPTASRPCSIECDVVTTISSGEPEPQHVLGYSQTPVGVTLEHGGFRQEQGIGGRVDILSGLAEHCSNSHSQRGSIPHWVSFRVSHWDPTHPLSHGQDPSLDAAFSECHYTSVALDTNHCQPEDQLLMMTDRL